MKLYDQIKSVDGYFVTEVTQELTALQKEKWIEVVDGKAVALPEWKRSRKKLPEAIAKVMMREGARDEALAQIFRCSSSAVANFRRKNKL